MFITIAVILTNMVRLHCQAGELIEEYAGGTMKASLKLFSLKELKFCCFLISLVSRSDRFTQD